MEKATIKVSVAIGADMPSLEGYAVKIETPAGEFQIGTDNNGKTYLTTGGHALEIRPSASNRILIQNLED